MVGTAAAVALWSMALVAPGDAGAVQFALTLAGITTLAAMVLMDWITDKSDESTDDLISGAALSYATTLVIATLVHISREQWAVLLEICCVAGLLLALLLRRKRGGGATALTVSLVVGIALVVQAWLVRWLAPEGELGIGSLLHLRQPALISLLWAAMGCVLTFWSRRSGSRPLWVAGAALLIASAVKMMLLDFGSLGQLTNILAVIAAGVVFLAVGWLAPMPPADAREKSAVAERGPSRIAVLIAITIGLFETATWYHKTVPEYPRWSLAPAPVPEPAPVAEAPSGESVPTESVEPEIAPETAPEEAAPEPPATEASPPPASNAAASPPAARIAPGQPDATREYVRPPVVDATGTANYNDYSYPVRKAQLEADTADARFVAPPSPGEKEAGVDTLLRQGRIVQATMKDLDDYMSRVRGDPRATERLRKADTMTLTQPLFKTYVARREFTMPEGLYGAHSITVIVPRGVPRPFGNPGHSQILEYPQDR